jgi:hypothetical protein
MTLPAEIARLIETFERNRDSYAQGRYTETQLRREYVDPFFKALGWDMDNARGLAGVHREVVCDDAELRKVLWVSDRVEGSPDRCAGVRVVRPDGRGD